MLFFLSFQKQRAKIDILVKTERKLSTRSAFSFPCVFDPWWWKRRPTGCISAQCSRIALRGQDPFHREVERERAMWRQVSYVKSAHDLSPSLCCSLSNTHKLTSFSSNHYTPTYWHQIKLPVISCFALLCADDKQDAWEEEWQADVFTQHLTSLTRLICWGDSDSLTVILMWFDCRCQKVTYVAVRTSNMISDCSIVLLYYFPHPLFI